MNKAKNINSVFVDDEYIINKTVFLISKYLDSFMKTSFEATKRCMIISRLDGELGISGKKPYPLFSSALTGLAKSLKKEWKNTFVKVLDLDPDFSIEQAGKIILEELLEKNNDICEIGRNISGNRITLSLEQKNYCQKSNDIPDSNTVFLVTGGGRGITACCVLEAAKKFKSKFILLGRTDIDNPEPIWADGSSDYNSLKKNAIDYYKKTKQKLSPSSIDKNIKAIVSKREVINTINSIKECGADAIYLKTDVTDIKSLKAAINYGEKVFGKINAVIHGAGNIRDKWIKNKSLQDYDIVFGTKIIGLKNIIDLIDLENIKFFVLFSSVAGYYGNIGQTDYSMANEVLNKFAVLTKMFCPENFVVSIGWGPWEQGMVSSELKKYYEMYNINTLSIEDGISMFVQEFIFADKNERQIIIQA